MPFTEQMWFEHDADGAWRVRVLVFPGRWSTQGAAEGCFLSHGFVRYRIKKLGEVARPIGDSERVPSSDYRLSMVDEKGTEIRSF
jgi:hypothetical protein